MPTALGSLCENCRIHNFFESNLKKMAKLDNDFAHKKYANTEVSQSYRQVLMHDAACIGPTRRDYHEKSHFYR